MSSISLHFRPTGVETSRARRLRFGDFEFIDIFHLCTFFDFSNKIQLCPVTEALHTRHFSTHSVL